MGLFNTMVEAYKVAYSIPESEIRSKFTKERYKTGVRESEGGPDDLDTVANVYFSWASELLHGKGNLDTHFMDFYLAERMSKILKYEKYPLSEDNWKEAYAGVGWVMAPRLLEGLMKLVPDPDIVREIIAPFKDDVGILLEAGVELDFIVDVVREVPVEKVLNS
jgi:hypothetical protein